MNRCGSRSGAVRLSATLAVALCGMPAALAQQPRIRTLTYDTQKKEWAEVAPPRLGTPAGDLRIIRTQVKDGQHEHAQRLIQKWLQQNGDAHELHSDILLAEAQALILREEFHDAHLVLQRFLNRYGGAPLTPEALRLEFVIAETFLTGVKRKLWGMRLLSGEDTALKILDEISTDYPATRIAELALKAKADHFFKIGDHELAEGEYARLLREYPRSQYNRFAWRRTAEAALASFGGVAYDEAALVEAQERYEEYRTRFPTEVAHEGVSLILDRIRELRAEKNFSIGAYYEQTNHLTSAVFYYKLVRQRFSDTIAAAKATARLAVLGAIKPITSPAPPNDNSGA